MFRCDQQEIKGRGVQTGQTTVSSKQVERSTATTLEGVMMVQLLLKCLLFSVLLDGQTRESHVTHFL